ncbi:MAG: hypothetical protein KY446_09125 [Proteobacteria bacterium]|nr:hypothetical protein [Pseudomonadota bacterium]
MLRAMAIGLLIASSACGTAAAQTYRPEFDPSELKGPRVGSPNAVMVLGTPHLSGLPQSFAPAKLEGLLKRLQAWRPQTIAIEALSGSQCDFMRRHPARYESTSVNRYCWDPAPARAATGLDVPSAAAEAERLLASWPAQPTPGQRRRLAAVFLAAGDGASGLVQWLRLPPSERRQGDGLDEVLVARLEALRGRRNENTLIAAPLAARLGLERVYPMDDHTAGRPVADRKAYGEAMTRAWDNPATAKRKAVDERLAGRLGTDEGVLAIYRAHNAPGLARLVFDGDLGAALEEPSPQQFGRGYLGYWETRNLRMAANIRDMLAARPGVRALVIVGAAHKGYLEAYLDQMHDVHLVNTDEVLR